MRVQSSERESHHSKCSVQCGERGERVGVKPKEIAHSPSTPPTQIHKAPSTQDERWCGERGLHMGCKG